MSKEQLSPLAALERIKNISIRNSDYDCYKYEGECFEIYKDEINIIETSLKALKIINEKVVNVLILRNAFIASDGVNYYNKQFENEELHLTQEEFDLLKEVLL